MDKAHLYLLSHIFNFLSTRTSLIKFPMSHLHDTKLTRYLTDPRYKNTGFEEFLAHTFDHELSDVPEIAALERAYFAEKLASLEEKLPE